MLRISQPFNGSPLCSDSMRKMRRLSRIEIEPSALWILMMACSKKETKTNQSPVTKLLTRFQLSSWQKMCQDQISLRNERREKSARHVGI